MENIEELFYEFAYDNAINFALRIDDKWRVDDVAIKFAEWLKKRNEN